MLAGPAARADLVYRQDFEGSVGTEWSSRHVEVTPVGSRRFLGQFANHTVNLHLDNLPRHTWVTLSFDVFVLQSWDGNHPTVGPDVWSVGVDHGPTLLRTTFSNSEPNQAFPDPYPGGDHLARMGAAEVDTLGYQYIGDSVYHLSFTFQHTGHSVAFNFAGSGLEALGNETWGLDNVSVSAGITRNTHLVAAPQSLNFGTVHVGHTKTRKVRLRNRGRTPIAGNLGFLLSPFRVVNGTGAFVLPAKGSMDVEVELAPLQPGMALDTLVFSSNDPGGVSLRVPVKGRGR
jgi:hypothetical protein